MTASFGLPANLIISEKGTVRDAMVAISANAREMILVRDDSHRILGLITDGNLPRIAVRLATLIESACCRGHEQGTFSLSRRNRPGIRFGCDEGAHVPACSGSRRRPPAPRHSFSSGPYRRRQKPNVAVLMAGGKGTRLPPITEPTPKPMVEIAGGRCWSASCCTGRTWHSHHLSCRQFQG